MKTAIRVLKAHEVEISGTFSLATGRSSRPLPAAETSSSQVTPQVRIAQQHPQYAILEITCACGHTMQIKCDYAQAQTVS